MVASPAGELDARIVFHAVVLRFEEEQRPTRDVIAEVVRSCLYEADTYELQSIAFPLLEEVVQDVLHEAWIRVEHLSDRPFLEFLQGIAISDCRNRRRRKRDMLTADSVLEMASQERTALARLLDEERDRLVEMAARNVLTDQEQEVLYLRYVLDHPLQTIASSLGMSDISAVRMILQRCRRRLALELTRLAVEPGTEA